MANVGWRFGWGRLCPVLCVKTEASGRGYQNITLTFFFWITFYSLNSVKYRVYVRRYTSTFHALVEMRRLFCGVLSFLFYFHMGLEDQTPLAGLVSQAPLSA